MRVLTFQEYLYPLIIHRAAAWEMKRRKTSGGRRKSEIRPVSLTDEIVAEKKNSRCTRLDSAFERNQKKNTPVKPSYSQFGELRKKAPRRNRGRVPRPLSSLSDDELIHFPDTSSDEEYPVLAVSDTEIERVCSEIVETLGILGADVSLIRGGARYTRTGNRVEVVIDPGETDHAASLIPTPPPTPTSTVPSSPCSYQPSPYRHDQRCIAAYLNLPPRSRSLLINKLIVVYRKLQLHSRNLQTHKQTPSPANMKPSSTLPTSSPRLQRLDELDTVKRCMRVCYSLLTQQLDIPPEERRVRVYHVGDVPTKVSSRRGRNSGRVAHDTLFEYLFSRRSPELAALSVKYRARVQGPDRRECKRIFSEVPPRLISDTPRVQGFDERREVRVDVPPMLPGGTSREGYRSSTFKVTDRREDLKGKVAVKEHYVNALSWTTNDKLYVRTQIL